MSRILGWALGGLLAAVVPAQPQNVLVLIADDLGVDYVNAYQEGSNPAPTPTIDGLAGGGVLFSNAWANAICSPSRASMQTGRHTTRTGVGATVTPTSTAVLPVAETTVPEMLDSANSGYAHGFFGKWHLGNGINGGELAPNVAGWSHYAGLLRGAPASYFNWARTVNGVTARSTKYATTEMVDDALIWIAQQSSPWVCYVSFCAPHEPLHAPPQALHTQNLDGKSPRVEPIPFYRAMIEAMDTEIGRMLATLGPTLADTTVIFLSDNGTPQCRAQPPFQPDHGKGTPYEGGINVPMIIWNQQIQSPGRQESALVHVVDLFPTVLELCGVNPQPPWVTIDGLSMVPYLNDPNQMALRTWNYSDLASSRVDPCPGMPRTPDDWFATARDAQFKLIRRLSRNPVVEELYDLTMDPFEQSDLLSRGNLPPPAMLAYTRLSANLMEILAPPPLVQSIGAATCMGSTGPLVIGSRGSPRLGLIYDVTLSGAPPSSPALLMIGASSQNWGPINLPLPLGPFGAPPNCTLYVSGEGLVSATTDDMGNASQSLPVPIVRILMGASVFHGWIAPDPGAGSLGVVVSNGLQVVFGA